MFLWNFNTQNHVHKSLLLGRVLSQLRPAQIFMSFSLYNPILMSPSYSRLCLLKLSNKNFVFISCFPIRATGLQHPLAPKLLCKNYKLLTDFRSKYSSSQHFVLKRILRNLCTTPMWNQKFCKNHFMKLYTVLVSLFQAIRNMPSLIYYELLFNSFEGVWSWLLTQSSIPSSSLLTSHKARLPLVFIALSPWCSHAHRKTRVVTVQ
jgi:hypothetical protein